MPKGEYRRKQRTEGYKDRSYWTLLMKRKADFTCQQCGVRRPARLLAVRSEGDILTLNTGEVLCFKCDAEREIGTEVIDIHELISRLHEIGTFVSERKIRDWARLGLVSGTHKGYLSMSVMPKISLLWYNRSLPLNRLRELVSSQRSSEITLRNVETGEWETLAVIQEFPAVSLDGRTFHCRRLINGDVLVTSRRRKENG